MFSLYVKMQFNQILMYRECLYIAVCILRNDSALRHWNPERSSTDKTVGSQLTLTCETNYWLNSSSAGGPVTTQNITCQLSGEWSTDERCYLTRKFKSIWSN